MKSSARLFSLFSVLLAIAMFSLHRLSAQDDTTLRMGDSLEDVGREVEFVLDAEAGQTVTLRWEGHRGSGSCDAPLDEAIDVQTEVTNADGDLLEQTSLLYTPSATIQAYPLVGTAPYHVAAAICAGSDMTLSVIEGDAIPRVEQPAVNIGETGSVAATSVGEEQLVVFPLNVQQGDVFTVDAHFINSSRSDDYPMYATVMRDANGHVVPSDFSERLPWWLSVLAPVYTVDGALPYRLELLAIPLYKAGYAERYGDYPSDNISYSVQLHSGNTAIEDAGLLPVGTRVEGVLSRGKPVIYTLDAAEGATMTLRREFAQSDGQFLLNADGDNLGNSISGTWIMSLVGSPPYTYYIEGEGSYWLLLEAGDTIERNEMGRVAPGEVLRVTMPAPDDRIDYITLDVTPETTVTLNWGVPQMDFHIQDSTGTIMYSRNDSWVDGYATVDLTQGTPPFIVEMGFDPRYSGQPYTFTLAEGETPLSPNEATTANTSANTGGGASSETDTEADVGCSVSAGSTINQRSGPGTTFAVSGTLAGGTSASVDGQTTDADGYTWYRLTTGGWVRGDLVTATAGCSGVPEAMP